MPAHSTEWTLEMLHALPDDGNRYELVDGERLVSPSPSMPHQWIVGDLLMILASYVKLVGGMDVIGSPVAITFSPRRELQPDLTVLPLVDGKRPRRFSDVGRVVLAIEVLSPSTARNDRVTKRRVYQEEGVAEYWIVDPDARCVERWRPDDTRPEIAIDTLTWEPVTGHDPLRIDLPTLFRAALD